MTTNRLLYNYLFWQICKCLFFSCDPMLYQRLLKISEPSALESMGLATKDVHSTEWSQTLCAKEVILLNTMELVESPSMETSLMMRTLLWNILDLVSEGLKTFRVNLYNTNMSIINVQFIEIQLRQIWPYRVLVELL